jgi:hypothetical protein
MNFPTPSFNPASYLADTKTMPCTCPRRSFCNVTVIYLYSICNLQYRYYTDRLQLHYRSYDVDPALVSKKQISGIDQASRDKKVSAILTVKVRQALASV